MQQGPPTLLAEVEERTLSHDAQQELGGEERGELQLEVLPRVRRAFLGDLGLQSILSCVADSG